MDCLFCKIISGQIASNIRLQTDKVLAFDDVNPSAETHVLIVPKKHIGSFLEINKEDMVTISEMVDAIQKLITENDLAKGYKIAVNGGSYQHVPHLHWHLLAGKISNLP